MAHRPASGPHPLWSHHANQALVPPGDHADAALRHRDLVAGRAAAFHRLDLVALARRAGGAGSRLRRLRARAQRARGGGESSGLVRDRRAALSLLAGRRGLRRRGGGARGAHAARARARRLFRRGPGRRLSRAVRVAERRLFQAQPPGPLPARRAAEGAGAGRVGGVPCAKTRRNAPSAALRSRVPGERSETRDPAGATSCGPWVPALARVAAPRAKGRAEARARPGHERVAADAIALRHLADASHRVVSYSPCQTAQFLPSRCILASGFCFFFTFVAADPPSEGIGGAPRDVTALYVSRSDARRHACEAWALPRNREARLTALRRGVVGPAPPSCPGTGLWPG